MKGLLMFIGGVVVGVGATYIYQKNRYEEMIQEEVESLRQHAKEKKTGGSNPETKTKLSSEYGEMEHDEEKYETEPEEIEEAENIINYNKYSSQEDQISIADRYKHPFVIEPSEVGGLVGFDVLSFTYYNDDVITEEGSPEMLKDDELRDKFGMSIDQIKAQFGVYEDDSVFVRNMRMKVDYEILRDESNFFEDRNGDR